MSDVNPGDPPERIGTRPTNPFPASAVARLSSYDSDSICITTPALDQAIAYVDDYLSRVDDPQVVSETRDTQGCVVAVVGEYGTGKTHLALQILRRIQSTQDRTVHPLYLDAPADTFLALYRDRFITKLSRAEVRDRVEEYYSDVVAAELLSSDLTAEVSNALKRRKVSPATVIHNLGLMESDLLQALNASLASVAEIDHFATALTLFLRPEFEAAVWEWLSCSPPDPALVDRGITKSIDTDAEALQAMGVIALLFGRQGHRLVVIMDELEKVLSDGASRQSDSTILAFKKLLEIASKTGAFLILSGLPDFLEALPEDARQRISCLVRPTTLTSADAIEYILESQHRASGERTLHPFTEDVVRYLVELAGGNARKIIRLCYHAYQAAISSSVDVTRAIVREVAREQFEISTKDDVKSEIGRIFDGNGWQFHQDHEFTAKKKSARCDYWLPVGGQEDGCAIVISTSILHSQEVGRFRELASTIKSSSESTKLTLLVVNGYLAENLSAILAKNFDRVIVYSAANFGQDFEAAVRGFRQRLEIAIQENVLDLVRNRVDEINRQNHAMRSSIDDLVRSYSTPAAIERAVETGLRRVFATAAGDSSNSSDSSNFPSVTRVFDIAMSLLSRLTLTESSVSNFTQGLHINPRSTLIEIWAEIVGRRGFVEAMSTVHILDQSVRAFRTSVLSILVEGDRQRDFGALEEVCRIFDTISDRLVGQLEATLAPEYFEVLGATSFTHRGLPVRSDISESLRGLARDVYLAAQDEFERRRRKRY